MPAETPGSSTAEPGLSGTLARGLAILKVLLNASQPMALAEIAALVDLDQSTTYRILQTLEGERYVLRLANDRRYLPSPKSAKPLALSHPLEQFRRDAEPVIAELANEFSVTIVLVVYLGGERLVVDVAQSSGSLLPYYDCWLAGPLHASGPGKALLAAAGETRRAELLGPAPYKAWTTQTKTTQAAVQSDIAEGVARGYVYQRDEYYEGITAVAANFVNWSGRPLGCIAATARSRDLTDARIAELGAKLVQATLIVRMKASSMSALEQMCGC